jgi:replication factor A1
LLFPDVIGIVKHANDISTITTKQTNKEVKKRDLELVDKSQTLVRMTLWGADVSPNNFPYDFQMLFIQCMQAESFDASNNPIVAAKGVRVSDFGGASMFYALQLVYYVPCFIEFYRSLLILCGSHSTCCES